MKKFPKHIVAVAGIVENDKGEVLLIKNLHGDWVWTGGQVENGETLFEALVREIHEESGVTVEVNSLAVVSSNTTGHPGHSGYEDVPTKLILDFACIYTGGELITHTDETLDARWIDKIEAANLIVLPSYKARYEAYLRGGVHVRYLSYASHPTFQICEDREI